MEKVIIEKDISPESIINKLISHIKLTKEERKDIFNEFIKLNNDLFCLLYSF